LSCIADAVDLRHHVSVTYALSFGPDFFWNEKRDDVLSRGPAKRPTSVEQAVSQLSDETWSRLAREVFDCEPDSLNIEAVLRKIEETNACLNLDPPIEVYIDPDGEFTVLVYDRDDA
jgi:hypothetical protein